MRVVLQRVNRAQLTVEGVAPRSIGEGLVAFLGVVRGDTEAQADFLADKICHLRIFKDEDDKMNRSLLDVGGQLRVTVETGEFGEHMHVLVENDGPVNIILDTERIGK